MGLTQAQKAMIEKARSGGGSELGISLDDASCAYLISVIAHDLGLSRKFPELPSKVPPFYEATELASLTVNGVDFDPLIERLVSLRRAAGVVLPELGCSQFGDDGRLWW